MRKRSIRGGRRLRYEGRSEEMWPAVNWDLHSVFAEALVGVPELRSEVLSKCDRTEIALAVSYQLTGKRKQKLELIRDGVRSAQAKALRTWRDQLDQELRFIVRQIEWKVRLTQLEEWFGEALSNKLASYVPKWWIEQFAIQNPQKVYVDWNLWPFHAFLVIDFTGRSTQRSEFEWYLTECALYEDMCIAYNNALVSGKTHTTASPDKLDIKSHQFFKRSAVLSAFYFVEAYLNGISFDYCYLAEKQETPLDTEDLELLLEWDFAKNCERWKTFRQKALQYPRIILGLKSPPFTETNCGELNVLLEEAKKIRDSIVHQSPRPDMRSGMPQKARPFFELSLGTVSRVVDSAIGFVRTVNTRLGTYGTDLRWLVSRTADGRFPDAAFR